MCYMALEPQALGWVDDLWFSGWRIVCQGPKVPCRMEEVAHGELLAFWVFSAEGFCFRFNGSKSDGGVALGGMPALRSRLSGRKVGVGSECGIPSPSQLHPIPSPVQLRPRQWRPRADQGGGQAQGRGGRGSGAHLRRALRNKGEWLDTL
jgi:hypothetical protein